MSTIVLPLMRPVNLPPIPTVSWWNLWGKAKNGYTLAKPRKWIIEEEYKIYAPSVDDVLCIPKGFVFDGASVPRVLWPFMSPTGAMFIPGLFHDFSYRYNCYYDSNRNKIFEDMGKSFYDKVFREMGIYINNAPSVSKTAWFGLFCGGFVAWGNSRERDMDPYDDYPKEVLKK